MAKKILALVLAVLMLAALSVSAFADDPTGTIAIANPQSGKTYTGYKIFDVTYSGTSYAYTISSSSPWLTTVKTYFDTAAAAADATVLSVTPKTGYSAAAFAAALKTAYGDMTDKPAGTNLGGTGSENLALGYWLVMTDSGALCNLTTTDPNVTIYDKNAPTPFDKDETTSTDRTITGSVQIGDVIPYEVTGKVPSTTGYSAYVYTVTDTITGAAFNKDVVVKLGTGTISPTASELTQTDTGFTLALDMTQYQDYAGKDISITYSATVDDSSLTAGKVANTATLVHSNDPGDATSTKTEPAVQIITKTFSIDVTKVNEDASKNLAGAEFVLKSGTKYYSYDATNEEVVWVDSEANAMVVTTGTDGKGNYTFKGLEAGTYSLVEINSPRGYKLPQNPFTVVITKGEEQTSTDTAGNITKWYEYSATVGDQSVNISTLNVVASEIANEPGMELPETGGIGTTIFYVLGSIFVIGAAVILLKRKHA